MEYLSFNDLQQSYHVSTFKCTGRQMECGWYDLEKLTNLEIDRFLSYLNRMGYFEQKKFTKPTILKAFEHYKITWEIVNEELEKLNQLKNLDL